MKTLLQLYDEAMGRNGDDPGYSTPGSAASSNSDSNILQRRIDDVMRFINTQIRGNIDNQQTLKLANYVTNTLNGARDRFLQ